MKSDATKLSPSTRYRLHAVLRKAKIKMNSHKHEVIISEEQVTLLPKKEMSALKRLLAYGYNIQYSLV